MSSSLYPKRVRQTSSSRSSPLAIPATATTTSSPSATNAPTSSPSSCPSPDRYGSINHNLQSKAAASTAASAALVAIKTPFVQQVLIDEEVHVTLHGYARSQLKSYFYRLLCVLTGGIIYLLCRWFPRLEIFFTCTPCPLKSADTLLLENNWGELFITPASIIFMVGLGGCRLAQVFPNFVIKTQDPPLADGFGGLDQSDPNFWEDIVKSSSTINQLKFFNYRYHTFIFNPVSEDFEPTTHWRDLAWCSARKVLEGVNSHSDIALRQRIFGLNSINVDEKPILNLMVDEVLHPFFVFQIGSIILWMLDEYYYYAFCIFLISTSSAIFTLVETKQTMAKIKQMSTFICNMRVWRNGEWTILPSHHVVPGDIFEVTTEFSKIVPCDAVLLDGDCILNESMLTGESIPVSKSVLNDEDLRSIDFEEIDPLKSSEMSRYFLFCGTKIIRVRGSSAPAVSSEPLEVLGGSTSPSAPPSNFSAAANTTGALAMVTRIGFNTTKGNLVRSMLFPKPNKFKFYRDSFRFIGVLTILAGLGFLASLYNFIALHVGWQQIVLRALDLITIVVPPALPATMAIGTSFAISRLKKSSIFCISPPRVNICGKIDMMCFDKTGTLTQEGLDVLGFRCSVPEGLPDDSPILEMSSPTLPFGKTCFSQLFKSALQVMPTAIPISSSKTPTGSSFAGSSTSPLPSSILSASLSTAHIDLNDCVPGHPNTPEKPFPYPMILCAMATCHSLKIVQGKLIGDPMDLKMFEFTGWHIEEGEMVGGNHSRRTSAQIDVASLMGTVVRPPSEEDLVNKRMVDTDAHKQQRKRPTSSQRSLKSPTLNDTTMITELCVVRQFEFVSSLRRMSVLVRRIQYPVFKNGFAMGTNNNSAMHPPVTQDLNQDVDIEVFVKGAPEVMKSICIASTIPGNYDDLLKRYAHKGYRILACAYKKYERANYASVSRLSRDEVEQNLLFLGFIIFENKLKPGTTDVIKSLSQSKIRQVMCTGDNVLTSTSVSRECELINPRNIVFVPRFIEGFSADDEDAQIVWEDIDESGTTLDSSTLIPIPIPNASPIQSQSASSSSSLSNSWLISPPPYNGYELAITGDVFQWMLDYAPDDLFYRLLVKCQIFARMSPEQKHILVENLQDIGYCVGFCGDGANDCGALKSADVGLSLSEAEASVAAPFTSQSTSLDCVPRLISEGRAALVTSFSCFKYMALYSLIQFTSVTLLYSIGGNLGDFQYLFIDLAIIIPVATSMSRSKPEPKLAVKRPTASLVSKRVLTSLIGQTMIQAVAQIGIYYWIRSQPYYIKPDTSVDERRLKCFENTVVFLVSCYQYIMVAFVFSVGEPYREALWKNGIFAVTSLLLLAFIILVTVYPVDLLTEWLELVELPPSARAVILAVVLLNGLFSWICERWVFSQVASLIGRFMIERDSVRIRGLQRLSPTDEESRSLLPHSTVVEDSRQEARKERWKKKGKLFKVVEAEMRSEAS